MSFAENLRQMRKDKGLSQEELAEIMGVSRQAVSKWEQGEIYPEVEKLMQLAKKFNLSLDRLLSSEIAEQDHTPDNHVSGVIIISSPNENVIAACCKVASSRKLKGAKNAPQYALFGVSNGGNSFWGEQNTFLGWYANHELLSKEMKEIQQAITQGIPSYELKYSAKVQRKWLHLSIIEE